MRHCPRCTFLLTPLSNDQVEIDQCTRCGGTFFDAGEVAAAFGHLSDPQTWVGTNAARAKGPASLRCPADGHVMQAYDVGPPGSEIEVDVCPSCRGVWFDRHEGPRLAELMAQAPAYALAPAGQAAPHLPAPIEAAEKPGWPSYLFQLCTGLPIEVGHPTPRKPRVVITLAVLLTIIFVGQVMYFIQGGEPAVVTFQKDMAMMPSRVMAGQSLHTLMTHAFLHLGVVHLLGNLYFLYIFGDNLEGDLGVRRFTAFYLTAALLAGLAQVILSPDPDISVAGASGAIAGLMGMYMVLYPRVKLWIVFFFIRFKLPATVWLGIWATFNVLSAINNVGGVAWFAHLGGFLVGVLGGLIYRREVHARYERVAP